MQEGDSTVVGTVVTVVSCPGGGVFVNCGGIVRPGGRVPGANVKPGGNVNHGGSCLFIRLAGEHSKLSSQTLGYKTLIEVVGPKQTLSQQEHKK